MNDHDSYNSVIITSQAGYDSVAVNVNKDFLSGGPWNHTRPLPVYQLGQEQNLTSLVQHLQNEAVANNLLQLEPTQCVDILNPKYQSIYRNLLILTDGLYNPDNSVWTIIGYNVSSPGKPRMEGWWLESSGPGSFQDNFYGFEARPPEVPVNNCTYETNTTCWLTYCTDTLTDGTCGSYADSMVGMTPEYCLVEVASEDCIVGISIVFLVVVIIANALKAGSLLYGYFKKEFIPLATTGDALSSFLTHPDPTTAGLGPLSALEISKAGFSTTTSGSNRTVRKRPYRWFKAPEPFRWYLGTLRYVAIAQEHAFTSMLDSNNTIVYYCH